MLAERARWSTRPRLFTGPTPLFLSRWRTVHGPWPPAGEQALPRQKALWERIGARTQASGSKREDSSIYCFLSILTRKRGPSFSGTFTRETDCRRPGATRQAVGRRDRSPAIWASLRNARSKR